MYKAIVKKVELNISGFNELRTCGAVMADLNGRAIRIQTAAGDGMGIIPARVSSGRPRGRATVFTRTLEARQRESHDRALSNAIGAGR